MAYSFEENATLYMPEVDNQIKDLAESVSTDSKKIIIELAAIHAGLTANYNNYPADELEKSLSTWVTPYPKPIITNHNIESDSVGRVMAARMDKEADGSDFIRLQIAVLGQDAVERCLDERFLTGSVGGRAESAKCSICDVDWANPPKEAASRGQKMPCSHQRGKVYNGKLAFLNLSGLSWKEYSFVNMPADQKSSFRSVKVDMVGDTLASEEGWVKAISVYSVDMHKESIVLLSESEEPVEILTEMKKKDARATYLNVKGTFLSVSAYDYSENDKLNEEKSLIDESHTTINNETGALMPDQNSEETEDMSKKTEVVTEEEDILAVASQLSADLAESTTDEVVAEEEVATEEEAPAEEVEVATEEVVTTEEETAPAEEATTDPELAEEVAEEAPVETTEDEVVSEEVVSEENAEVATLNDTIDTLKTENTKLKQALHYMLAERVVDAKIAVGVIEADSRNDALTDHSKRTASSLGDALRDLKEYPVLGKIPGTVSTIEMDVKAAASDKDDNSVETITEGDKKIVVVDHNKKLEDTFTDVFMNRKKLS